MGRAGGAGFGAENDVPPAAEREVHTGPVAVHMLAQLKSCYPWQVPMGPASAPQRTWYVGTFTTFCCLIAGVVGQQRV